MIHHSGMLKFEHIFQQTTTEAAFLTASFGHIGIIAPSVMMQGRKIHANTHIQNIFL